MTAHASIRHQQRGLRGGDEAFVMLHGTETAEGFVLTRQDVAALERRNKREIELAHRLCGTQVICDGPEVITSFKARRRQIRKGVERAGGSRRARGRMPASGGGHAA